MTDTYTLDGETNNKLDKWTDKGYTEKTGSYVKNTADRNDTVLGPEVDRGNIDKLRDNEDVLVKEETQEIQQENPEKNRLENQLKQKQEQISQVKSKLRDLREDRREEKSDLQGLQNQLDNQLQERENLLDKAQELRNQGNISKAQQLEGQAGALTSNQIAETRRLIREQERTIQGLTNQIDNVRNQVNTLEQEAADIRQEINDLEPVTETRTVLQDVILVCRTEYETYISGAYIPPNRNSATRIIEGKGPKEIVIGAKAPIQNREKNNEQDFWDNIYNTVRQEVFRNPGGFPEGEWINQLIQELNELGPAGQQGQFQGSNWRWSFGPSGGTHEFPEPGGFTNDIQDKCETLKELQLTRQ